MLLMKCKLNKISIIALLIIVFSLSSCKLDDLSSDSATIKEWISDGALIVDVRTPGEFEAGHYKNSINIPLNDMEKNLEILGDKSRPIIVHCRSGWRSIEAKKVLEKHGYEKVLNAGGLSNMPD